MARLDRGRRTEVDPALCRAAQDSATSFLATGHSERWEYEYEQHGTANLFVIVEPLAGWGYVAVTEHRVKQDCVERLRYLVAERYRDAERISLVQDNHNLHTAGAPYETFPPTQARNTLDWLNQGQSAEIGMSIFEYGCLSRPVGDRKTFEWPRVATLETERNERRATIDISSVDISSVWVLFVLLPPVEPGGGVDQVTPLRGCG